MKTKELIERKILEITKEVPTSNGSKAVQLRAQIEILNWVIDNE